MRSSLVKVGCSSLFVVFAFCGILFPQESALREGYNQTLFLIGEHRYDEAIDDLKQIIGRDSSFYPAYLKIVSISTYQHTLEAAETYFSSGLIRRPDNPYLHHALGLIYRERKAWLPAYQHILKALQLNFYYYPAYRDFVSVNRSTDEAERTFKALLQKSPDVAAAYCGLAHIYSSRNLTAKQLDASRKALQLQPDLLEARYYFAEALYRKGDLELARGECGKGIADARERQDIENEIDFQDLNGFIVNKLGDFAGAVAALRQAVDLAKKIGDRQRHGTGLNSLARIHWYEESYSQALQYAQQALQIETALGDESGMASNLSFVGIMQMMLGDYSAGLNHYYQAKEIYESTGNVGGVAVCTGNIASAYLKLGNHHKALTFVELAIKQFLELGNGWQKQLANYLRVKGVILNTQGKHSEALTALQQSLQILTKMNTEEHQISNTLTAMGDVYKAMGDYMQARDYYTKALETDAMLWQGGVKAQALLSLGNLYLAMHEYGQAREAFSRVSRFGQTTEDPKLQWRAEAGLATVYEKEGNALKALECYSHAMRHIEYIKGNFRLGEDESGFFSDKLNVYTGMVTVLYALHQSAPDAGYARRAFVTAQRAKATILLDLLNQDRVFDYLRDVQPGLKERYRSNRRELEQAHLHLSQQLAKPQEEQDRQAILNLKTRLTELQREKIKLLDAVKENYPEFHRLANRQIFSVQQIQREILADNQLLMEFLAAEETLYLWAVSRDDFRFEAIDLSKQALEEKLAHVSPLFAKTKETSGAVIDHRWANMNFRLLHELYQLLVERPLGNMVQPGMELIIVPDDLLHYFPFELLVTKDGGGEVSYLAEAHPVLYTSSSSLLQPQHRAGKMAPAALLAFGNPDFGREPSRGIVDWIRTILPATSVLRGARFKPLPFAEQEVKAIAENFAEAAVFVEQEATELKFKENVSNYGYIHLATHNLANDQQPMYSKIVLAQQESQTEDGFLQTYEVFDLDLRADLVVLSGCSTGLGKLRHGEGLIGMSRAFLYAGANNVLVSLWPVKDESTAQLMTSFYANLKKGMTKTRALQQAKMELIHARDWRSNPFYWGAFILRGDR